MAAKKPTVREQNTPAQAAAAAARAVRAKAQKAALTKEVPPAPPPRAPSPRPQPPLAMGNSGAVLEEIRDVKRMVQQLLAPARSDDALDASVDSLRRLLSELIDERLHAVMEALVEVRREAAALPGETAERVLGRIDHLLEDLGAVRFVAEPMDLVDPLIHLVVEQRGTDGTPAGVILDTLRPGYRTARGRVLCKAAVAVSRSS